MYEGEEISLTQYGALYVRQASNMSKQVDCRRQCCTEALNSVTTNGAVNPRYHDCQPRIPSTSDVRSLFGAETDHIHVDSSTLWHAGMTEPNLFQPDDVFRVEPAKVGNRERVSIWIIRVCCLLEIGPPQIRYNSVRQQTEFSYAASGLALSP
jgi:hypothetical protein